MALLRFSGLDLRRALAEVALIFDRMATNAPVDETLTQAIWDTLRGAKLFPKRGAYLAINAQGLGIIRDDRLRKAITDLFELDLSRIEYFEQATLTWRMQTYHAVLHRQLQVPLDVLAEATAGERFASTAAAGLQLRDWEAMRSDPDLSMLLLDRFGYLKSMEIRYGQALESIDALLVMIDRALAESA
ncbi:MAG: hypothetical protein AAGH19_12095 [Pseudomonadota bacterium]